MLYEKVKLSEEYPYSDLTVMVAHNSEELKNPLRRAVIICPGGGYQKLSDREGECVAKKFFAEGFNVFILKYGIKESAVDFAPLTQAALAVAYVRNNAQRFNIDPSHIFIMGFSAGGHLAASAGILWESDILKARMGDIDPLSYRPDGMILCYPVISGGKYAHRGSFNVLYGRPTTPLDTEELSLELHVSENTCPAFIWHTATDKTVPVQNALLIANALVEKNVSVELHIFPKGKHGLSLANEETSSGNKENIVEHVQVWIDLAIKWAKYID